MDNGFFPDRVVFRDLHSCFLSLRFGHFDKENDGFAAHPPRTECVGGFKRELQSVARRVSYFYQVGVFEKRDSQLDGSVYRAAVYYCANSLAADTTRSTLARRKSCPTSTGCSTHSPSAPLRYRSQRSERVSINKYSCKVGSKR